MQMDMTIESRMGEISGLQDGPTETDVKNLFTVSEIAAVGLKYGITWCVTYRDWQLLC
jgi:hypothetical protein